MEGATGGGGQAGGGDCCEATGGGRGEAQEGAEEGESRQVAAEREGQLGVGHCDGARLPLQLGAFHHLMVFTLLMF